MNASRHPPAIRERLALLNEMATYDELERALTFPRGQPPQPGAAQLTTRLNRLSGQECPDAAQLPVWSFDIDLTLAMPEDEPGTRGPIPVQALIDLQQHVVVGTCSDREPSDQRDAMAEQDFQPDFCIPKEMLHMLAVLLPGAAIIHVGDDPRRDRDVAAACSVTHRWPGQAFHEPDPVSNNDPQN